MRSSKSRSRSKSNRPRTIGNIVNRVFDSSGPEGKVRGTPQQIIEKYQFLARDAQLSNDRVAAENFMQHAEHYTRMLGEAQRELAAEQEARQQSSQQNGHQARDRQDGRGDFREAGLGDQPDVVEPLAFAGSDEDSPLIDTPEARPREPHYNRDRNRDTNRDGQSRDGQSRDGQSRDGQSRDGQSRDRNRDRPRDQNRDQHRDQNRDRPREPREARDQRSPRMDQDAPRAEPARAEPARSETFTADAAPQPEPRHIPDPMPAAVIDTPPSQAPLFDTAEAAPKPKRPAAPRKPRAEKPKAEAPEKPEAAE